MNLLQKSQRFANDPCCVVSFGHRLPECSEDDPFEKTIPDAMRYDHEWIHADPENH